MSSKRKHTPQTPLGNLGEVFNFSQDDLAANRAGFMTLSQQFGFSFMERRLYVWLFNWLPISKLFDSKRRQASRIRGKIKKHHHARLIQASSGGGGGGHADVLEQFRIAVDSGAGVETFYVREKQYTAIPENVEVTVYYDDLEQRILSVELPSDEQN